MDLGRLRKGEWLAAVASIALLGVMFLPWFGLDGQVVFGALDRLLSTDATAWQAFTIWDVVLATFAAMGLGLVALAATRRAPAAPVAAVVITTGTGIVLSVALLFRIVFPPGPNALVELRYGAWLGLLCVIGVAAGAWLALGDERTEAADPPFIPAQPVPPEAARAGSMVAEGRAPEADDDRD